MRHIICYEGVEKIRNQILEPNSLQFVDEKVPVVWQFTHMDLPFAYASDFRREEGGVITAEIGDWTDVENAEHARVMLEDRDEIGATIWATDLVARYEGSKMFVQSARLREVSLGLGMPWIGTKAKQDD